MGVRAHFGRFPVQTGRWLTDHPDHRELVIKAARGWIDDSLLEEVAENPDFVPQPASRVGREAFERFVDSAAFEEVRGYHQDVPAHDYRRLDIDKTWRVFHPLLTGRRHPVDLRESDETDNDEKAPESLVLAGPEYSGEHWACHVLGPDDVADIWERLEPIDRPEYTDRFEQLPDELAEQYADEFEWTFDLFCDLAHLFYLADDRGDCIVMWWSY